jgi:two-component sensor histidine kinase/PAS domain-containing protein
VACVAIAELYAPAYVLLDEAGDVLHFSGRTGRFLERASSGESLNLLGLVHADLRLELGAALRKAAAERRRVEACHVRLHAEGEARGVNLIVEPISVAPGEPRLSMVLFQDAGPAADGRPLAEAALRAAERRFGEAQRLAGIGVWEWSLDTGESWWSPEMYKLWGLAPGATPPRLAALPLHPQDRTPFERALAAARHSGEVRLEWRVMLPDGTVRWLCCNGRLEPSEHGRRILGVAQDISEAKQTETRLKLLLGELQHRVRNILNVVRSIVSLTVHSASSIDELASHLGGRLDTLARTQAIFTRSSDEALELEDMVRDEMVAAAAREQQVTVAGPPLRLRREAAETLALALHELTTNAVKYGALSRDEGVVDVRWRVVDSGIGPRLLLEWQERGVPAVDLAPKRSGFGRELIERGLPYELGATTALEFGRGGVRALIELPLNDRVAVLEPSASERGEHEAG